MITIASDKCTGCGQCIRDCFPHYLTLVDGKAQATGQRCLECGHCVAICPQGAVQMSGYEEGVRYNLEARTIAPEVLAHFMQWRRSIRQFADRPVPQALLAEIIDAGRLTPTGSNSQSPAYMVLQKICRKSVPWLSKAFTAAARRQIILIETVWPGFITIIRRGGIPSFTVPLLSLSFSTASRMASTALLPPAAWS